MAEKQRGFIADEIRVEPKRYGPAPDEAAQTITLADADPPHPAFDPTTSPRIGAKERQNARYLAHWLTQGFAWAATEDGKTFWSDVVTRLHRIGTTGR